MNSNMITNFNKGERFTATVRAVRDAGVYIKMPRGGSGIISTRCWGEGQARAKALARICPGDRFEVEVVSWHPQSKTLSLILPRDARHFVAKRPSFRAAAPHIAPKPAFKPLAEGALVIVDAANYLAKTAPEHAAAVLEGTETALLAAGYKVLFFLEHRARTWLLDHQASFAEEKRLKDFCARDVLVLVKSEADLPILQLLEATPGACAVTLDRFADYRQEFPALVGSDRLHGFSVVRFADKLNISIDGVRQMVSIDLAQKEEASEPAAEAASVASSEAQDRPRFDALEVGRQLIERGKASSALQLIGRAAKKNPAGYFALAEAYEQGVDGVPDPKAAAKYERLGRERAKRNREAARRDARQRAARWKGDMSSLGHVSFRRVSAMRIAASASMHKDIVAYLRQHKGARKAKFVRAA